MTAGVRTVLLGRAHLIVPDEIVNRGLQLRRKAKSCVQLTCGRVQLTCERRAMLAAMCLTSLTGSAKSQAPTIRVPSRQVADKNDTADFALSSGT